MSVRSERCPFVVVVFPEKNNTLAAVPAAWIVKERGTIYCRWPTKSSNVAKLARLLEDPGYDWDKIKVNVLHYAPTYACAVSYKNSITSVVQPADRELTPTAQETLTNSTSAYTLQETTTQLIRLEEKLDKVCKSVEKLAQIAANNAALLRGLNAAKGDVTHESIERITTFDKLQQLEERMKDMRHFSKLANLLSTLGGKNEYEATRRILSNLISHDLAIKMNWMGSLEKKAITEFPHVVKLVAAAVKLNTKYQNVTQYTVENQIKRWLRYASDRNGGRLKRKRAVASS